MIVAAAARDHAYVRSLGADAVIDWEARFEDVVRNADAVVDLVGGEVQTRSFAVLRTGGVLISAVSPPDQSIAAARGVSAAFFLVDVTTESLARIAAMLDSGTLITSIGTVLPLAAARAAHEMLDGTQPRPRGKIVLRVAD